MGQLLHILLKRRWINIMDNEFVRSYYNNNHYYRSGIFLILSLVSLLSLISPMGEVRFVFLTFLLFIPILVVEFVYYYKITKEFNKDIFITKRMKLGRMSIIIMKKERVGIKFEGLIDGKACELKYYTLKRQHEAIMNNLKRYTYIEFDYYNKTKVVKDFRSINGE